MSELRFPWKWVGLQLFYALLFSLLLFALRYVATGNLMSALQVWAVAFMVLSLFFVVVCWYLGGVLPKP